LNLNCERSFSVLESILVVSLELVSVVEEAPAEPVLKTFRPLTDVDSSLAVQCSDS
jgi:hypothetical protein